MRRYLVYEGMNSDEAIASIEMEAGFTDEDLLDELRYQGIINHPEDYTVDYDGVGDEIHILDDWSDYPLLVLEEVL